MPETAGFASLMASNIRSSATEVLPISPTSGWAHRTIAACVAGSHQHSTGSRCQATAGKRVQPHPSNAATHGVMPMQGKEGQQAEACTRIFGQWRLHSPL